MPKKDKKAQKKAERRERAKMREESGEDQLIDLGPESGQEEPVAEEPAKPKKSPKPAKVAEPEPNIWERFMEFLREVDIERKKVNWPSIDEAWRSTWVVVFTIVFLAAFMGVASWGFNAFTTRLFGLDNVSVTENVNVPGSSAGLIGGPGGDEEAGGGSPEGTPGGTEGE
ncbi:MAG TPA: preprotein translocase subunit SecE [bacterium]|jgi:preprotein translocase subunit SecE